MDHPTFADTAFISALDKRLGERFPNLGDVVGEEVPGIVAECFRAWLGDPMTRAVHHPLELRELAELLAIQWGPGVLPNTNSFSDAISEQLIASRGDPGIGANAAAPARDNPGRTGGAGGPFRT